jgi:hypothetical protein
MSAEVGSDTISATELTKLLIVIFSMKWLSPGPLLPEFLLGGAISDSILGGVSGIGGSPVVQGLFLEVLAGGAHGSGDHNIISAPASGTSKLLVADGAFGAPVGTLGCMTFIDDYGVMKAVTLSVALQTPPISCQQAIHKG